MSDAPTDRGFPQRETGMDQGTTPEGNIIGLLGEKKKPGLRSGPLRGVFPSSARGIGTACCADVTN
jgi:hypothetical protein